MGRLLESIEFDEYKAVFAKNKIDGKCLMECSIVEDAVNMGIKIFVKAKYFLKEIKKLQQLMKADDGTDHEDTPTIEAFKLRKYKEMEIRIYNSTDGGSLSKALISHSSEEVLILCVSTHIYCLHMVKEYKVDLIRYFPELDVEYHKATGVKSESNMNHIIKFILHGSGFEDADVQLIVSLEAAKKIYAAGSLWIIKEIQSPMFGMQDNDWTSSILSFEPSGVVFEKEDCLIVITPTLMTWKDNDKIHEQELLDALTIASRDKESGMWSPCFYSDDKFHGVIGINEKDLSYRIVIAYALEHFCAFRVAIAALLFASQAISFGPVTFYPRYIKVKKTHCIADVS